MKHVDFGEDVYYLAADKDKTMVSYMSAYYGKKGMCYLPEALYKDIIAHPSDYKEFHSLPGANLYAKETDSTDQSVKIVRFDLRPAVASDIPMYLRPVSKYLSTYTVSSCSPNYSINMRIGNNDYMIVPTPIKGMAERVEKIALTY
jgi:hypothetical protein